MVRDAALTPRFHVGHRLAQPGKLRVVQEPFVYAVCSASP